MMKITQPRFSPSADLLARCQKSFDQMLTGGGSAFPELPKRKALWEESRKVGLELRSRFDHLIVVGIGGSSLGPQVIAAMKPGSRLRFFEGVDAHATERVLHGLDLNRTGFLVVSKSGGTIETLAGTEFLRQHYDGKGLDFKKHVHVLTEKPTNSLGTWATKNNIGLTVIPSDVGGRYSVLSPVGMIPAVFDGHNVDEYQAGAAAALENKEFVTQFMAQTLMSWERGEWITFFWTYDYLGRMISAWIQQLWAESLGKKTNRAGKPAPRASTPMGGIGPADQHSVLQQLSEGAKDKLIVFVRSTDAEKGNDVLKSNEFAECTLLKGRSLGTLLRAEAIATEEALHRSGVSTLTVTTEVLNERGLAEFMMLLQLIVGGLGEALGIDPFDQPGVELGKKLIREELTKP